MITKPSAKDPFGYDDAGRPVAVKLTPAIYAFGYDFCHVLQTLMKHGCRPAPQLFENGAAFVLIYSPHTKQAELWSGKWKEDEPKVYSIVNPEQQGMVDRTFSSIKEVKVFAKSQMTALGLTPGQIQVPNKE